jgi:hypothetical protein
MNLSPKADLNSMMKLPAGPTMNVIVRVHRQDMKLTLLDEDVNAGIHLGLAEAILL